MAESAVLIPLNRPPSSSSPPPNCAICLGTFSNKCFSDSCMHEFCFKCLLEWSKIKAECPLCKKAFKVIIHSVKSNNEYDEHVVQRPAANEIHIIDNEEFTYELPWRTAPQQPTRFHFRTTFTVDTRGEHAIQQMLLSHPLTNGNHINMGGYPISRSVFHHRRGRDNTSTSFRRSIYTRNLWVNSPPDLSGHYRDISPGFYRSNPGARARLVPWLNRELNALLYENTQLVMHVVDVIMDHLLRHHICSIAFRSLLFEYLNSKTDHFIHEFYSFMRSPFDMIGYDRHVIYTERPPTPLLLLPEDESSDSDVIIVGSSNPQQPVVINLVDDTDSDEPILVSQNLPMPAPVPHVCPPATVLDSSSPAPDMCRPTVLDSSSTGPEVTEVKERKPLLPLKLRLKRKRQSRENKNRLRRKKGRTGRSRSSSRSSFHSKMARDGSSSSDTSSSEDSHKRHNKKRKSKKSSSNKRSHKYHRRSYDKHVDVVTFDYSSTSSSNSSSSDSDTDNMPLSSISSRDKKKSSKLREIFSSYTPPKSYTPPLTSEDSVTRHANQSEPGCSRYVENNNKSNSYPREKKYSTNSGDNQQPTTPHLCFNFSSLCHPADYSNHSNPSPYVPPPSDKWSLSNNKSDSDSSNDDCPLHQLLCKVKKKTVPSERKWKNEGDNSSSASSYKPYSNTERKDSQWKGVMEGPSTSGGNNYKPRLNNIVLRKEEQSDMWYTQPPNDSESSDY